VSDWQSDDAKVCAGCGGPYRFDTSVPSSQWNRIIRAQGLPEYLCTTCIMAAFAHAGEGFTATFWGDGFTGLPIEVRINGAASREVAQLRAALVALRVVVDAVASEFEARSHGANVFALKLRQALAAPPEPAP
jgi:hypothetical protein